MTYAYIGPFKIDAKIGFNNFFYAQKLSQSPKIIFLARIFAVFLRKNTLNKLLEKSIQYRVQPTISKLFYL